MGVPSKLAEHKITHILSVIKYSLESSDHLRGKYAHLSIDVDDMDDEDLLVHLPKCVRFIERGLYPPECSVPDKEEEAAPPAPAAEAAAPGEDGHPATAATSAQLARLRLRPASERRPEGPQPSGAVFVHCAMGKSRSVSVVAAYLLWKYPHRFGAAESRSPDRAEAAREAVARAVKWIKESRGIAEPNPGFTRQLEMWWEMGRPADTDDAVERHPVYQRWLYKREVEESVRLRKAPDWIRFEDEETEGRKGEAEAEEAAGEPGVELRCKKCRRVLATTAFIVPHEPMDRGGGSKSPCPHYFVEPLSWMRPVLEQGELDGRLVCPNQKCASSIGRYAWPGFKCSCREWVCPAFSLQRSKVDEVKARPASGSRAAADARTTLNIRLPPSGPAAEPQKENL